MCRQEQLHRCEDKESDGNEGQTILVIGQTEHADGGVAEREELLEDAPLYIVCRNVRMNLICHQFTYKFSSARPFLSTPERMYRLWRVEKTCRRAVADVQTTQLPCENTRNTRNDTRLSFLVLWAMYDP